MNSVNNSQLEENGISQVFTPHYVAEFMVNECKKYLILSKRKENLNFHQFKILETSVGRGAFLKPLLEQGFKKIVAYELDKQLKPFLLKEFPEVNLRFENVLGSDLEEKYDLIVGNPPYLGQNYNAKLFQTYVQSYPICQKYFVGNMDLLYFFIHLGIEKLNPGGILSLITTNYWIKKSKHTGIKLLKPHIMEECFFLEYVDLSNLTIFKHAKGQHNCIFFLQKKAPEDKRLQLNKKIQVIQVKKNQSSSISEEDYSKETFRALQMKKEAENVVRYESGLTNNDLQTDAVWNLTYPQEVKEILEKIEKKCIRNGRLTLLKDFFIIRNGLIFTKDDLFILKENDNLKIENDEFFVKVNGGFIQLSDREKERLKKIYKSKAIKPFTYQQNEHEGHAIFFDKFEVVPSNFQEKNEFFRKNYPHLTAYLEQFQQELESILINAKENPKDIYFPRRGSHVRKIYGPGQNKLVGLERLYERGQKIFIRYITNENVFGYSQYPYYATSDTYFLWPKIPESEIDYPLILAYLNSKLMYFIFKAKNITIKRSKSKLEQELPIINPENFNLPEQKQILSIIRQLSNLILDENYSISETQVNRIKVRVMRLINCDERKKKYDFAMENEIASSIKMRNVSLLKHYMDSLFFALLDMEERNVTQLLLEYYE